MKKVFYSLVFALSSVAFAGQQQQPAPQPLPPQQLEVVEFNTYFEVFVCTKIQQSQDYNCQVQTVSSEKATVQLEKSAQQPDMMVGTLSLAKDLQDYRHLADVRVAKHTVEQGTHYGFHIEDTFYKSAQQMPDVWDHTFGAVHTSSPASLNEVTFYGRIVKADDKLYIPVLVLGPATTEPQQRKMKMNPALF